MKRIYITLILLSLLLTTAHAQFLVTKTDNTKTNVEQNVGFTRHMACCRNSAGRHCVDYTLLQGQYEGRGVRPLLCRHEVFGL